MRVCPTASQSTSPSPAAQTIPALRVTYLRGVVIHHVPELHPDDVSVVKGVRTTSPSRTLIDLAEVMDVTELRECFANARDLGLLDLEELAAARARVEWRPSLAMLDEVIAEFS